MHGDGGECEGVVEEIEMSSYDEYYKIAEKAGVFSEEELKALVHVLDSWTWDPDNEYSLVEIREDGKLVGFATFGRSPLSKFCWDIYWIVVKKSMQNNGYGKRLLKLAEEKILKADGFAVLRIETSNRDVYASARKLYVSCGFKECCRIDDYFDIDDDLIVYFKHVGDRQ
jgi:ribosomal protein S18 acetylase RimI-like enzyme